MARYSTALSFCPLALRDPFQTPAPGATHKEDNPSLLLPRPVRKVRTGMSTYLPSVSPRLAHGTSAGSKRDRTSSPKPAPTLHSLGTEAEA